MKRPIIAVQAVSGKCCVCGCTELNPCLMDVGPGDPLVACSWVDFDHTLCSNFRCIGAIPLDQLCEMTVMRAAP